MTGVTGAEFIHPIVWRGQGQGGSGWELLIFLAAIASVVAGVLLTRLFLSMRKSRRFLTSLTSQLHLEAGRALRDPVLVHQARRAILETRNRHAD